jgi:uncharacterized membrane protein
MPRDKKEAQFGGVKLVILGVVLIVIGAWVATIHITTYTSGSVMGIPYSYPSGEISLAPLGIILILVGVPITILGIWHWTSNT